MISLILESYGKINEKYFTSHIWDKKDHVGKLTNNSLFYLIIIHFILYFHLILINLI